MTRKVQRTETGNGAVVTVVLDTEDRDRLVEETRERRAAALRQLQGSGARATASR